MVIDRDRAMVTHMHPPPVPAGERAGPPPPAAVGFAHLEAEPQDWFAPAAASGMRLFADIGWDPDEKWSPAVLDAAAATSTPSCPTASRRWPTRTPTTRATALHALAEHVPVAVVTCGGQGAIGVDALTGEEEWVPALPVNAHDPTGAGDVFGAAFVLGTLHGWPLRQRLAFANLCASLSVQYVGGSLAAPGWGDIVDWLAGVRARAAAGSQPAREQLASYAFLQEIIPTSGQPAVRRAAATIARLSDAAPPSV